MVQQTSNIQKKLEKMAPENSFQTFWKERRKLVRDDESTWQVTKDDQGRRIFDPEENRINVANYYENLYKAPVLPGHDYHKEVEHNIQKYEEDRDFEEEEINEEPTIEEVKKVISKRKNGKATTDIKNELVKKGVSTWIA